jgi:hypothetical protein
VRNALLSPHAALASTCAIPAELERKVKLLRARNLVGGNGTSGLFVPDTTPERSKLVFSLTPPSDEGRARLLQAGLLAFLLRGRSLWQNLEACLIRVAAAADLFAKAFGPRSQLDGLLGRVKMDKAGNAAAQQV